MNKRNLKGEYLSPDLIDVMKPMEKTYGCEACDPIEAAGQS
jgi:hypothetical protein